MGNRSDCRAVVTYAKGYAKLNGDRARGVM